MRAASGIQRGCRTIVISCNVMAFGLTGCLSVHVLPYIATIKGDPMKRRGRDFAHWFKMFRMAQPEHCKSWVYFIDQSYIDVRAQMGRVSSAHLRQRASFLIMSISMRRAARELVQRLQQRTITEHITQWADQRRTYYAAEKPLLCCS